MGINAVIVEFSCFLQKRLLECSSNNNNVSKRRKFIHYDNTLQDDVDVDADHMPSTQRNYEFHHNTNTFYCNNSLNNMKYSSTFLSTAIPTDSNHESTRNSTMMSARNSTMMSARNSTKCMPKEKNAERIINWIFNYFQYKWPAYSGQPSSEYKKQFGDLYKQEFLPPLYFQHHGHSRTVIGTF